MRVDDVGATWLEFGALPKKDLLEVAEHLGIDGRQVVPARWLDWLVSRSCPSLLRALNMSDCCYFAEHEGETWLYAGPTAMAITGSAPPPPAAELADGVQGPSRLRAFSRGRIAV